MRERWSEWDDLLRDNDDGTGHLAQGIGFEGYINELFGRVPTDIMSLSGDLTTEFVQTVYGYNGTWKDFIYDFNPEWIVYSTFDKSGGSTVQERLSSTYFAKEFVSLNPASKLGSSLGSLLSYYAGTDSGIVDDSEFAFSDSDFEESYDTDEYVEDDVFEQDSNDIFESEQVTEPVQNTTQTDSNEPFFSSLYNEPSNAVFETSHPDVNAGWSDEDRLKVAGLMVDAYLLGKKGTSEYAKLADPSIRSVLDKTMLSLLLKRGY